MNFKKLLKKFLEKFNQLIKKGGKNIQKLLINSTQKLIQLVEDFKMKKILMNKIKLNYKMLLKILLMASKKN